MYLLNLFLLPSSRAGFSFGLNQKKQKFKKKLCFSPLLAILRKTTKAGKASFVFFYELPIHTRSGSQFLLADAQQKSVELPKY
ncbi:MAG: hypothetical protein GX660_09705 [Clostridiaceae bacterium]|nr:hypothetical protein [Clostridiaceae bacterium]